MDIAVATRPAEPKRGVCLNEPPGADLPTGMTSIFNGCRVSMFENAYGTEPRDIELSKIIDAIRSGRWQQQVARVRPFYLSDPARYRKEKVLLPAFAMSGTAKSRTEPLTHSGFLQVDLDHLDDDLHQVRELVRSDPYVAFGFVSPSGAGLKLGVRIEGSQHGRSFQAAEAYFRERYGREVDTAVKDPLRLCFVSFDPDAWVNPNAAILPLAPTAAVPAQRPPPSPPRAGDAPPPPVADGDPAGFIILPSGKVSFTEAAQDIFARIAPTQTLFWRGGTMVELEERDGVASLDVVRPEAFRSRVENFGTLMAWRSAPDGRQSLKPVRMPRDDATALMATTEAKELLPPIASVLRCPVLIEPSPGKIEVLGKGYHPEMGGLLIVAGETPPVISPNEAAEVLRWIVDEFAFQSPGDHSRALAALLTPALRMGGHLTGPVPIDIAEAKESQSGKGYRHHLVVALYGESSYLVTARQGGVGSMDESFAAALIAGRPFICLDNFRGRLDSQHLEAFVTCPTLFPARIPHRGEVQIDPRRFLLQMSSNGLEATRDLANRGSICRISKRPGFKYRDTLGEVQRLQSNFLGCVFSLISAWITAGKPRTSETRHDFTQWCQTVDWIVQNLMGGAPVMEGHPEAQERVSNPALSWLRSVALAVEAENRLGDNLIASALVEICAVHDFDIPGVADIEDEEKARKQVGMLMRRVFREGDSIELDGFTIQRVSQAHKKPSGDMDTLRAYVIRRQ
jgi:hypothetical protein